MYLFLKSGQQQVTSDLCNYCSIWFLVMLQVLTGIISCINVGSVRFTVIVIYVVLLLFHKIRSLLFLFVIILLLRKNGSCP